MSTNSEVTDEMLPFDTTFDRLETAVLEQIVVHFARYSREVDGSEEELGIELRELFYHNTASMYRLRQAA